MATEHADPRTAAVVDWVARHVGPVTGSARARHNPIESFDADSTRGVRR
jgi:hypothetical protein